MTFSQRIGLMNVRNVIQVDALDNEPRVALWNIISPYLKAMQRVFQSTTIQEIWTEVFHQTIDSKPQLRANNEASLSVDELRYRCIRESFFKGIME